MWVICLGARRSGSTLQYNILSRIVELKKVGERVPYHKPEEFTRLDQNYSKSNHIKVLKTHDLNEELETFLKNKKYVIFYCYRDIRDVVVSYINKGWAKKTKQGIESVTNNYISSFNQINNSLTVDYIQNYENFVNDLESEIVRIGNFFNIELSNSEVGTIAEELDINRLKKSQNKIDSTSSKKVGSQEFNKETLIHSNHINNGEVGQFKSFFNEAEIILIEKYAWKWLLVNGYQQSWNSTDTFLSASQHGDDFLAYQIFNAKNNGVVVEVGAFDGLHLSNSFSLSCKGWNSICVEPNPNIYQYLKEHRGKKDLVVNKAVVGNDELKLIDFFSEETGVLSGCNYDEADVKRRHNNRGLDYKEPEKIKVGAETLNSILNNSGLKSNSIDVISIDVEGFEMEVLNGLSLDKWKIGLFIIEANTKEFKEKILNYFKLYPEYILLGENYQNMFIVHESVFNDINLKNLKNTGYIPAKQYHPVSDKLNLNSIPLKFLISSQARKKKRKLLGLFNI